ncbi:MAG: twin arginine translocase [Sphingomonas bacterium]|jgi:sec-independent protein translocase protein TatA|nr:twin arginine translocase [Sphingomonas bacterium]MDB5683992.1 twin arginine translocase [Sphingomonas bacterium]MDB5719343.1 twin arginine translocase [Sphingomonas bacterium]
MGGLSLWHWLVVGIVVLLLFGKGRFSDMMGDVAKGIKSFKKGMTEEEEPTVQAPPARLQTQAPIDPNPDRDLQPMKDDRPHS